MVRVRFLMIGVPSVHFSKIFFFSQLCSRKCSAHSLRLPMGSSVTTAMRYSAEGVETTWMVLLEVCPERSSDVYMCTFTGLSRKNGNCREVDLSARNPPLRSLNSNALGRRFGRGKVVPSRAVMKSFMLQHYFGSDKTYSVVRGVADLYP